MQGMILILFRDFCQLISIERVTGRKARGPQVEEIDCKCQTFFFSLLVSRRKQTTSVRHFFSPSLYIISIQNLQARLQQYLNHKLPDVQAGFSKGRGTRDQVTSIRWIIEKARAFQKNIDFCFIDYARAFDCVDHNKLENSERDVNTRPPDLAPEKSVCRSRINS